jgi:hypothetical protein
LRLSPTTKRVIESSGKSQENHIIEGRFHTGWTQSGPHQPPAVVRRRPLLLYQSDRLSR